MNYAVEITSAAKQDISEAYRWLDERSQEYAARWLEGLQEAVQSLSQLPRRCGLARESRFFREEVRQLLYGKRPNVYRVLFIVRRSQVFVLHVRHAARENLAAQDFEIPADE